jgi:hypothetical protein
MELLGKEKGGSFLLYALAYLLLIVTAVVAALAIVQLRLSIFAVAGALISNRLWLRVVNIITWMIQVIVFAVYVLIVEHAYREAVTQARIRSARAHPGVEEPNAALYRFFRRFDLDMLAAIFVKFFAGTLIVFMLLFGLQKLLLVLIPG